ncbi:unnamed protein product [Rotaria sp. Silwood2]|nr:unnamed protein product [Rotaria sp. Silwood2]
MILTDDDNDEEEEQRDEEEEKEKEKVKEEEENEEVEDIIIIGNIIGEDDDLSNLIGHDIFTDSWEQDIEVDPDDPALTKEQYTTLLLMIKCRKLIYLIKKSSIFTSYFDPTGFLALSDADKRAIEHEIKEMLKNDDLSFDNLSLTLATSQSTFSLSNTAATTISLISTLSISGLRFVLYFL